MGAHTILFPSIAPGITRSVTLQRKDRISRVLVDDVEILSRVKGGQWQITTDFDDLAMIADAARGAWRMTRSES